MKTTAMNNNVVILTEHFKFSEFDCKDGTPVPKKYYNNVIILAEQLEVLRASVCVPIIILSGYRTNTYNAKVGGVAHSQHLLAKAADIVAKGYDSKQIYYEIENLIAQGKMKDGGLGLYDNFVHYDIRAKRARW